MKLTGLLFNNKIGSDLELESNGKNIYLHKSILSNYHIYFKNLFNDLYCSLNKFLK